MRIPRTAKITGRSSSITNAFIQAILPTRQWTTDEETKALSILGMKRPDLKCAYCGSETSEWDHLYPLVRNKKPTGFIHEIRNLVPSCGRCNHSKSGADWHVWFRSKTANSPTRRGVPDVDAKFNRLEDFVLWGQLKPIVFSEFADEAELEAYWHTMAKLQQDMTAAQLLADKLKPILQVGLNASLRVQTA